MPNTYHQRLKTESQRFAEKYEVKPSGCWEWKELAVSKTSKPYYPSFKPTGRKVMRSNRYAWEQANHRALQEGECVCHRCDNPKCVNPAHLFLGSHTDNMKDKARKRRSYRPVGAVNPTARFTKDMLMTIRLRYQNGETQRSLAKEFKTSTSYLCTVMKSHWTDTV